jgi:hypothetical protein
VRISRRIRVQSCCDHTEVDLDLTDAEFAIIRRLADATAEAHIDGHQPTVEVTA